MIEFKKVSSKYVDEAVALAMTEYEEECKSNDQLIKIDFTEGLKTEITELFQGKYGSVAIEGGKLIGYLAFVGPWDGFFGLVKGVFSPLGGSAFSGSDRGKLASRLFEEVGSALAADGICSYALSRYAYDEEVGRSFVMNGFGIRCSDAIMRLQNRDLPKMINTEFEFCELVGEDKKQIEPLKRGLTRHLCAAPTFFPSDLDVFAEWFEQDKIRVFTAKHNGEAIGYLAIDDEAETFVTEQKNMVNICSAYVKQEYRNQGIASMLLEYLCEICEKDGMEYLGVDCETLNPTALRFWGKYFANYTYSYARRIDERVVGYENYLKQKWGEE